MGRPPDASPTPFEYVVFHVHVETPPTGKPMLYRTFLWGTRLLSCPVFRRCDSFDLVFNELEKRQITVDPSKGKSDCLWLIIYSYDVVGPGEHRFLSCAACRLPKAKSPKYFGRRRVLQVSSKKSSNPDIHPSLHKVLASFDIPAKYAKTLLSKGPSFTVMFTPFFGVTKDILSKRNLKTAQIVPPVQLPSPCPPHLRRLLLTFTIRNVRLETKPSTVKAQVRLLDLPASAFLDCIEGHDGSTRSTQLVHGTKAEFHETFTMDLSTPQSALCCLFIAIQIDCGRFFDRMI
jgi:hypothetical protein